MVDLDELERLVTRENGVTWPTRAEIIALITELRASRRAVGILQTKIRKIKMWAYQGTLDEDGTMNIWELANQAERALFELEASK
jgi:hypothetical protein